MVVLTILLAAVFASGFLTFDAGLEGKTNQFEEAAEAGETAEDNVKTASANPWSGNSGDLVRVSDNRAGASDVKYRINFTIRPGSDTINNSLNSVKIDVTTGAPDMFSGTDQSNLEQAFVDSGSDGTADISLKSDLNGWSPSNGGSTLKIEFGGNAYPLPDPGDSVVVVFDGVDNPSSPGTYDVEAVTSGDGNTHNGTIEIVAS
jgi:hypothetical protein